MTSQTPRLVTGPWSASTAGLLTRDHHLSVPLDRASGDRMADGSPTLTVYAREVLLSNGGTDPEADTRPPLVFLQGGPGCESPRPTGDSGPDWLRTVLERYRLFLLDQRGTGASRPIDRPDAGGDAAGTARLLTHMRADEIVEDCEDLRRALGYEQWSVLGQSFGGFCVTRYLTVHADSVETAFLTGGLPAVGHSIDEVYALTYQGMRQRSRDYYERFPADRDRMADLVERASRGELTTAAGEVVGVRRLQSLGILLGASGGMDMLHALLERDPSTWTFRHDLAGCLAFGGRAPLYSVIHESSWADGGVTDWAAERCRPADFDDDPTLLTGEHVLPEHFDEDASLRPWRRVADILAAYEWPALYDAEALRACQAHGAAAVYARDLYVPLVTSLETAALIPGVRTWVTSEYEHNGLRASGGGVFRHLDDLAKGLVVR